MSAPHVPVLLDRVVSLLAPALADPGSVLVDATLGLGGHTEAALTRCPQARVIGIDRDAHALERSRERLAPFGERVAFVHAVYDEIADVLDDQRLDHVDAVLFDLGVSSMQLDVRERGFAYAEDAPLDMRMNDTTGPTAADVLNTYAVADLARIGGDYKQGRSRNRAMAPWVPPQPPGALEQQINGRKIGNNQIQVYVEALLDHLRGDKYALTRLWVPSALAEPLHHIFFDF